MRVSDMREILRTRTKYAGSRGWESRLGTMSDKQIMAIYYRMLNAGDILEDRTQYDGEQLRMSVL